MSQPRAAPGAFHWLVFPLVMSAAVAWSIAWMANATPAPESILVPQLSAFALVAVLEHVYPYHRSWNRPRRDVRVDATHITAVHGIFQHANLQLRLGSLNHFFSMAELHRWHHSKTIEEANHNYGQTIIVWDTLFGTRFLPLDRKPPEDIGIPNLSAFPMTWWAQIRSPFRWQTIQRESAESVAPSRSVWEAP
jgi:sterol desaturase/sphingolipid hydroxylase (fatty acid hydroxylase superfamily)